MRASVTSLSKKFIAVFFAATLALGLVPAAAFAADDDVSSDVISSDSEKSALIEQNGEAVTNSQGKDQASDNTAGSEDPISIPAATERVNEIMPLEVVAQSESTRNYFLAQTLESTRTVPMVSAQLPMDAGASDGTSENEEGEGSDDDPDPEDSVGASFSLRADEDQPEVGSNGIAEASTVVGSFEYRGIIYAVEPGGESVAVVAADPAKLPADFIEAGIIVLPSQVSFDSIDYYSVTRIADRAFTGISGIDAVTVPASITTIEDDAFADFDTLQYVIVSEDNQNYSMYDGALYDADQTSLLLIPEGRKGAVRIAPSVTEVDPEVFSHCPSVDSLVADADSAAYDALEDVEMHNASNGTIEVVSESDTALLDAVYSEKLAAEVGDVLSFDTSASGAYAFSTAAIERSDDELAVIGSGATEVALISDSDEATRIDIVTVDVPEVEVETYAIETQAANLDHAQDTVNGFAWDEPVFFGLVASRSTSKAMLFNKFTGSASWTRSDDPDVSATHDYSTGPAKGSLVTINVESYVPNWDAIFTEELFQLGMGATSTQKITGFEVKATNSFVSLETIYSGKPFSFSYYMGALSGPTLYQSGPYGEFYDGCFVDKERGVGWHRAGKSPFDLVYEDVSKQNLSFVRFYPNGGAWTSGLSGLKSDSELVWHNQTEANPAGEAKPAGVYSPTGENAPLMTPQTQLTNGDKVFLGWYDTPWDTETVKGSLVSLVENVPSTGKSLGALTDSSGKVVHPATTTAAGTLYARWGDKAGSFDFTDKDYFFGFDDREHSANAALYNKFRGTVSWTASGDSSVPAGWDWEVDGPHKGSLVTVNVDEYIPNWAAIFSEELFQVKMGASNGTRVAGLWVQETGSYLSVETIYSGKPFSFSYVMDTPVDPYGHQEGAFGDFYNGRFVKEGAGVGWHAQGKNSPLQVDWEDVEGQIFVKFWPGTGAAWTSPISNIKTDDETVWNNYGVLRNAGVYSPTGENAPLMTPQTQLTNGDKVFLGWYDTPWDTETVKGSLVSLVENVPSTGKSLEAVTDSNGAVIHPATTTAANTLYARWIDEVGQFDFTDEDYFFGFDAYSTNSQAALFNKFRGTVSWTTSSDPGVPANWNWEVDGPYKGSLVTVNVEQYNANWDAIFSEELFQVKMGASNGSRAAGLWVQETGSYLSVETIYSGKPFSFSYIMGALVDPKNHKEGAYGHFYDGCFVKDGIGIGWHAVGKYTSPLRIDREDVEDQVFVKFYPGADAAWTSPLTNLKSSDERVWNNNGERKWAGVYSSNKPNAVFMTPQTQLTNGDKVFKGWYTAAKDGTQVQTVQQAIENSCVVYAQWEDAIVTRYGVRYDANDSRATGEVRHNYEYAGLSQTISANVGEEGTEGSGFVLRGYEFVNWNTDPDGNGTTYNPGDAFKGSTVAGDVTTLYAQWRARTYTVEYDSNYDGANPAVQTQTRAYNASVAPLSVSRDGYELLGWSKDEKVGPLAAGESLPDGCIGKDQAFSMESDLRFSEDVIPTTFQMHAVWRIVPYTLTIQTTGSQTTGMGTMALTDSLKAIGATLSGDARTITATYDYETADIVLPTPKPAKGWAFKSWSLTIDGGTAQTGSGTLSNHSFGNRVYTAAWESGETYSIDYVLGENDGSKGRFEDGATAPESYKVETPSFTVSVPVMDGYWFTGWTVTDEGSKTALAKDDNEDETIATVPQGSYGNKTFTAKWTPVLYTVTLNIAGDSLAAVDDATFEDGIPASLQGEAFAFGANDVRAAGGSIFKTDQKTTISSDKKTVTVPFTYESAAIALPNALKLSGLWSFSSWKDASGADVSAIPEKSHRDYVLSATWIPIVSVDMPLETGAAESELTLFLDTATGTTGTAIATNESKVTRTLFRTKTPVPAKLSARSVAPTTEQDGATYVDDSYARAFFYGEDADIQNIVSSMRYAFAATDGIDKAGSVGFSLPRRSGVSSAAEAVTVLPVTTGTLDANGYVEVKGTLDLLLDTAKINDTVRIHQMDDPDLKAKLEAIANPAKHLSKIIWTVDATGWDK